MTEDVAKSFGLPGPSGARRRPRRRRAARPKAAGIKVGDVIVEFNGKTVKDNNDLVDMVMRDHAGHDGAGQGLSATEADDAERQGRRAEPGAGAGDGRDRRAGDPSVRATARNEPKDTAFGMTLRDITPASARELGLPASAGRGRQLSRARRRSAFRAGLRPGDVILAIDGHVVTSVDR